MAKVAYVKIEGAKQGLITQGVNSEDSMGNKWQEGHEDEATVVALDHRVVTPTDPLSSQPTGSRVHKPFMFTEMFGKDTPMLYQALAEGERLTTVTFKFFRTFDTGGDMKYFEIMLTDATIVEMHAWKPNVRDARWEAMDDMVDVHLVYRAIQWDHVTASSGGGDDWRKPAGDSD